MLNRQPIKVHILNKIGIQCWIANVNTGVPCNRHIVLIDDLKALTKNQSLPVIDDSPPKNQWANNEQDIIENELEYSHYFMPQVINTELMVGSDDLKNINSQKQDEINNVLSFTPTLPLFFKGIHIGVGNIALSAMRFGEWLILVDNDAMEGGQMAIWQSLLQALQKSWQNNTNQPFLYLEWADDWAMPQEREWALAGFFWRLLGNQYPSKLALLTGETTIQFDDEFVVRKQHTPTLMDMEKNAEYKKVFWQLLHAN